MRVGHPSRANAGAVRGIERLQRIAAKQVRGELTSVEAAVSSASALLTSKVDEAPNDGNYYGRKGGVWARLTTAVLPPT